MKTLLALPHIHATQCDEGRRVPVQQQVYKPGLKVDCVCHTHAPVCVDRGSDNASTCMLRLACCVCRFLCGTVPAPKPVCVYNKSLSQTDGMFVDKGMHDVHMHASIPTAAQYISQGRAIRVCACRFVCGTRTSSPLLAALRRRKRLAGHTTDRYSTWQDPHCAQHSGERWRDPLGVMY